jgi:hypothetical protein
MGTSRVQTSRDVVCECSGVLRLKKPRVEMLWCTAWQPKLLPRTPLATVTESCATVVVEELELELLYCNSSMSRLQLLWSVYAVTAVNGSLLRLICHPLYAVMCFCLLVVPCDVHCQGLVPVVTVGMVSTKR